MVLEGQDIVAFSNDWSGDPLSKTHLMRILARRNRILWVDSLGNRAPRAQAHDLGRILTKARAFARGIREVERNLHVMSPLAVPFFGNSTVEVANGLFVKAQISGALKWLGMERPISWSFLPSSAPVVGHLGEKLVVYQCVDEFSAFADTNGSQIAALEEKLLRRADLVITSAERLRERKSRYNSNTVLVRHGVDYAHFVKACDPTTPVAFEVAVLNRPILGFFGLVAQWVDLEAIAACAQAYPGGSVVLIGKVAPDVDLSPLRALPNVHVLGRKPYAALPGYAKAFDVALLPFKVNELTLSANPLKVREYLAAGLPCVATDLPEIRNLGMCTLASAAAEFPAKVAECLKAGAGPSLERAQRMSGESWEARVEEISAHLGRALGHAEAVH